jgi:hypothetical protein
VYRRVAALPTCRRTCDRGCSEPKEWAGSGREWRSTTLPARWTRDSSCYMSCNNRGSQAACCRCRSWPRSMPTRRLAARGDGYIGTGSTRGREVQTSPHGDGRAGTPISDRFADRAGRARRADCHGRAEPRNDRSTALRIHDAGFTRLNVQSCRSAPTRTTRRGSSLLTSPSSVSAHDERRRCLQPAAARRRAVAGGQTAEASAGVR